MQTQAPIKSSNWFGYIKNGRHNWNPLKRRPNQVKTTREGKLLKSIVTNWNDGRAAKKRKEEDEPNAMWPQWFGPEVGGGCDRLESDGRWPDTDLLRQYYKRDLTAKETRTPLHVIRSHHRSEQECGQGTRTRWSDEPDSERTGDEKAVTMCWAHAEQTQKHTHSGWKREERENANEQVDEQRSNRKRRAGATNCRDSSSGIVGNMHESPKRAPPFQQPIADDTHKHWNLTRNI